MLETVNENERKRIRVFLYIERDAKKKGNRRRETRTDYFPVTGGRGQKISFTMDFHYHHMYIPTFESTVTVIPIK